MKNEGYEVLSAYDGIEGMEMIEARQPDMVVLDLMMPGMNGLDVCREVRKSNNVPILMLTAKGEEIDRILGLSIAKEILDIMGETIKCRSQLGDGTTFTFTVSKH